MNSSAEKLAALSEPYEEPGMNARPRGREQRDWSSSLNLVHRAGLSLREAEDQTQKLVARAEAILERANQELEAAYEGIAAAEERAQAAEARAERSEERLKEAEARAQMADSRARAAEARAQLSENRAAASEEWLQRIHEAILAEFSPQAPAANDAGAPVASGDVALPEEELQILAMRHADGRKLRAV
jgi:hypothetical protein